ncbi:hypothetical protein ACOSP7_016194 [Xanthoceras sorbifolium]
MIFWRKVDAIADMNPRRNWENSCFNILFCHFFYKNPWARRGSKQKNLQEKDLPLVYFSSSSPLLSFAVSHDLFQDSLAHQH